MLREKLRKEFIDHEKNNKKPIFKKNIIKSMYFFIENTIFIIALYYICYKVQNNNPLIKYSVTSACLFFIGVLFWGQFVLGHDMGHESFSDYYYLNKILGIFTHGTILVPFQQWRLSLIHI